MGLLAGSKVVTGWRTAEDEKRQREGSAQSVGYD